MSFFQSSALLLAAVPTPGEAAPAAAFYESASFINFCLFIGLIVASTLSGKWLAKILRVGEYGTKFSIILFALLASVVIVLRGWPPKLGVNLGGGSILVYKVDETKTNWKSERMDSLLASIGKRVDPGKEKEIRLRKLGDDMVEIVMPSVSGSTEKEKQVEADWLRKIIRTTGALEFRIVATRQYDEPLINRAKEERKKKPADWDQTVAIRDANGKDLAKWVHVRDKELDKIKFDPAAMMVGKIKAKDADGKEVEKEDWEVLVLMPENKNLDVTGDRVPMPSPAWTRKTASPRSVSPSTRRAGRSSTISPAATCPRAISTTSWPCVLDNVLQTAPELQTAIGESGRITGNFDQQEVNDLVEIINAGSLPAALEPTPVRDMTTEATLGAETIRQSSVAMIISSIVVPLFMLFYYRFAGLVAVMVLALNMLMLVAFMILFHAPFTLPALAGLALTVGMAVDNNVLIYERLREEIAHGAALRMAIRNAFHRVGVVIIDANITHLIAATVLYVVGTEQIKGFAVTFWLGAILSIWATMFVARVMFEVAERRRWVQKLVMMQWIGHTSINFMAWFPACATFSVVITMLGLVVAGVRGKGLLDIDFTGGVSVQTVFQEKQDINEIRKQIESIKDKLPDATVSNAHSQDEPDDQRFIIDTSNSNNDNVKNTLRELFDQYHEKLVNLELNVEVGPKAAPATQTGTSEKPYEKTPEKAAPPAGGPAKAGAAVLEEKPSEPPVDKSLPAAEAKPPEKKPPEAKPATEAKPTAAKPTAAKPAEAKPADAKPAETKPAEPKPAALPPAEKKPADAKPAENKPKQSQADLPALNLVAMAGNEAVLLAEAAAPPPAAGAKPPETSGAKPAEKGEVKPPAAKPESKPEAKPEPKPEAKPGPKPEAKLEAKAQATPQPQPEKKPAAKEAAIAPANPQPAETGPASPPLFEAQLKLASTVTKLVDGNPKFVEQSVRYDKDQLASLVAKALQENEIDPKLVDIVLGGNEERVTKSDHWDVTLSPKSGAQAGLTQAKFQAVLRTLQGDVSKLPFFPIEDNVGTVVAADTQKWAVVALVSSWSLIILYLWIRFQGVAFGLAAVIALIHDVLVMLGAIAFSSYLAKVPGLALITGIEPFKINLPIVAAFLTIIGYSVNDTIVVFDRIREIRGKSPTLTRQMVNDATNQTLSRTVLTSLTVMMVVVILYAFGGQAVKGFAFALIIGVLTGTYSSIYVAAPILLWLLHPKEMAARTAE